MPKLSVVAGANSVSIPLFIQDSSSTIGAGLAAVAPAGGSLLSGTLAYYTFAGANAGSVAISLSVLATVGAAWSSGGIVTIDDTHMKGWVRVDIPNAVVAASKGRSVGINIYGGTNMAPCAAEIELTGWDNQDAVHGGLSAIPNAAAGASGGLVISGSNAGTTTFGALTVTGATTLTGAVLLSSTLGVTGATTFTGVVTASAGIAANVTGNLIGTVSTLTTYTGNTPQTGDSFARIGALGAGLTALAPSATALSTAQWTNGRAADLDNLDVAVSTRLATSGYTTPPAAATIAGLTWDIVLSSHSTAGSTGAGLASASSAGDPWATAIPGAYASGTAGNVLGNKSGYALSSAGLDAVPVESGLNFRQAQSIIASAVAGLGGDTSGVYKGAGVATTRITFSASGGERTAITLSPPA